MIKEMYQYSELPIKKNPSIDIAIEYLNKIEIKFNNVQEVLFIEDVEDKKMFKKKYLIIYN